MTPQFPSASATAPRARVNMRHDDQPLRLVELDPYALVDGEAVAGGIEVDLTIAGRMRETCPDCGEPHLLLVLRQTHVKRAHLVCPVCTRCYDALYEDGSCALVLD